eukprot:TRINITY_DN25988_c0_g4_i1.p1 TRINITY_DN25988_c0_g4~~TRINITY_DN25988_c0_g4_i1.p1  ORF type:complete len:315 (+),score=67.42 TRINITY_DN25988_c0_g4_i1:88-1032(+)
MTKHLGTLAVRAFLAVGFLHVAAAIDVPSITLNDGSKMPALGLGVYVASPGEETYNSVKWALEVGYRMIDTAQMYRNEQSVGDAIRDSGIPRRELWIQSKLDNGNHGYDKTIKAVLTSLAVMGLDYLDCYLIHSPFGGSLVDTYDALLKLQKDGKLRTVGVSNYDVRHLEPLRELGRPTPVMNQVEMHPLLLPERDALVEYCQKHNILVQAYGSIFFGNKHWLSHEAVKAVEKRQGKTAAQVLLRWGHQRGFQLIPKSVRKHRLEENAAIWDFELTPEDMAELDSMNGNLGAYWNPLKDAPVDLGDTSRFNSEL